MKSLLVRILSRTFSNLKLRSHCHNLVILDKQALHEILLRVDPNTIFNCILVNKEWLEVIVDPEFRRKYNRKWKNISKVVGFFQSGLSHPFRLSATTKLGSTVNDTKLPAGLGQFIAKSSSGDGLILSGIPPSTFFISDLTTGSVLLRLPPPPAVFDNPAVAIISSYYEDSSFTVIIAGTDDDQDHDEALNLAGSDDDNEPDFLLNIQTFSSSSGQWQQSTRRCSMYFSLSGELGAVSSDGVVYLRGTTVNDFGCLAVYDTKISDHSKEVGLIFQPGLTQISAFANRNVYHAYYGVCSERRLWSATRRIYTDQDWDTGEIRVWVLEDDGIDWKLQYTVNPTSIWEKNVKLLKTIYKQSPQSSFDFVSFSPGRSDSVYLRLGKEIFVYQLDTGKLQLYGPRYHSADSGLIPVTVAETGAWPCSPVPEMRLIRSSRSRRRC